MAEKDYEEDVKAAADWGQKAAAASAKADSLRAGGDEAGATKWDDLAKVAIGKQIQFENEIKAEEPSLKAQREVAERLKQGLARDEGQACRAEVPPRPADRPREDRQGPGVRSPRLSVPLTSWIPQASSVASRIACVARRPWPRARPSWPPPAWTPSSRSSRPILRSWRSRLASPL